MKVLVVDDSGIMRRVMSNAVTANKHVAVEAKDGADALIKLKEHKDDISLIILDWNMPVMDGYEMLCEVRAQREYDHIPILMATTDGVKEDVLKALKAGATNYLVKPFEQEALVKKIAECLFSKSRGKMQDGGNISKNL